MQHNKLFTAKEKLIKYITASKKLLTLYTVPKAILRKEMFVSTERNVSPVLKKCFSTANSLSGKGKPVLIKTNVSFAVFLSLCIKISFFHSVRWEWGKIFFHLTQMFLYSVFLSMRMKLSSPLRLVRVEGVGLLWRSTSILSCRPDYLGSIPAMRTPLSG